MGRVNVPIIIPVRYFIYYSNQDILLKHEIEDSSEIASARVSSSHRKSIKRRILNTKQTEGPTKIMYLSKISEEDINDNSDDEVPEEVDKMNDYQAIMLSVEEK